MRHTSSTPQHRICANTALSWNASGARTSFGLTQRMNRGAHASSRAMSSASCVLKRDPTDAFFFVPGTYPETSRAVAANALAKGSLDVSSSSSALSGTSSLFFARNPETSYSTSPA